MQEKENVLRILKETKRAVKENNSFLLRELSNQTVHTSSIHQDADNIAVAIIVYSLSKIIERRNYRTYSNWPTFYRRFLVCINNAILALEKDKLDEFHNQLEQVRRIIEELTGNLKLQIQDVFRKAEINKASRIYEHGISMEQTAKLLGISIWELAEYSGGTGISEVNLNLTLPEKKRIKYAIEIFEK